MRESDPGHTELHCTMARKGSCARVSTTNAVAVAVALLLATVVALTTSCTAAKLARRAHLARVDLAGLTLSELQACAGEPLRVERTGGWQYLYYVSPRRPDQDRSTQCVATFMVRNGYVEDLDYTTPGGGLMGHHIAECLAIVDPCLPEEKE